MSGRAVGALLVVLCATGLSCRDADKATAAASAADASLPLLPARAVDAAALDSLGSAVPPRAGRCAQVKSLKERAEADTVAEAMRKATGLPVEVLQADLGPRGTWWRLCVGDEDSDARLVARATRWTGPGGELEPFLDEAVAGQPRFFVLERVRAEPRRPTDAAARALLSQRAPNAPVFYFGGPTQDRLGLASTAPTTTGATEMLAVDEKGQRLPLRPAPAPGCASCELALREGPVTARRAVASADLTPHAGEELVVEEDTERGARLLSALAAQDGGLRRVGSLLLGTARPGFFARGQAAVVEADADPQREVVVATTELRVQGDAACALERHAEIFDATEAGLVRVDPMALPAEPADALINAVTALDAAGDALLASRVCAAHLARDPRATLAHVCLDRVAGLLSARRAIDAVNAGALIAEGAPSLRAAVAGPLLDAVQALDADVRLSAAEPDCALDPLVPGLAALTVDEALKRAAARAAERVALGDLVDAVFVTGARDFGPDTPVGLVTVKWLERLKVSLPARYAAVEALLLPPAPAPTPAAPEGGAATPPAPVVDASEAGQAGPGFGGGP